MVHGPVREVVRGPSPLDWSTDRGSVFSGHPWLKVINTSTHVSLYALRVPVTLWYAIFHWLSMRYGV